MMSIMRLTKNVLLITISILLHQAQYVSTQICNDTSFWLSDGNKIETTKENVTKLCSKFACLTKCCPIGMYHFTSTNYRGCYTKENITILTKNQVDGKTKFDYSELKVYKINSNNDLEKSNFTKKKFKIIFNHKFYPDIEKCTSGLHEPGYDDGLSPYLLESGKITLHVPNRLKRYNPQLNHEMVCFEYLIEDFITNTTHDVQVKIHFMTFEATEHQEERYINNDTYIEFKKAVLILSCIFLLLVLVVYASLPELRKIGGMIQMAYCATYMLATFFLVILLFTIHKIRHTSKCKYLAIVIFYLFYASFFWMNIMSFDIWWSFRGWYKQRQIHRRGQLVKFGWYALYAWGTPLLIIIAVTVLDNSDLSDHPNIVKIFFEDCLIMTDEYTLYYNYPVGGLLAINFLFFLLTAYNYWRIKKNLDQYQDQKSKKNRFMMYFKLAVIMGIGWILDIINSLPDWLEITAFMYNGLIGVVIFFIFVFKRKIFLKLCKRYGLHRRYEFVQNLERKWSISSVPPRSQKKPSVAESDIAIRIDAQTDVESTAESSVV